MNARYYVPGVGRFASADSIVPNPANPQSFNRYSYGLNNPVKYTDPTGHYVVDQPVGIGCSGASINSEGCGINPYTSDGSNLRGEEYRDWLYNAIIWLERNNGDPQLREALLHEITPFIVDDFTADDVYVELLDPDFIAGLLAAASFRRNSNDTSLPTGSSGASNITIDDYVYSPSVQRKIQENPTDLYHNFPSLLDADIMSESPILVRMDGRQEFIKKGFINGTVGAFHITLGSDGQTIIHRAFIPRSGWNSFANIYGLPTWSSLQ